MKHRALWGALLLAASLGARAAGESLEYKIAVIDAGRYIPETDTSVARVRAMLPGLARCYRTPAVALADIATKGAQTTGPSGAVGVIEILDAALTICPDGARREDFVGVVAYYLTARRTGQPHHAAVHGQLILRHAASQATGQR